VESCHWSQPTLWQFAPSKETFFLGKCKHITRSLRLALASDCAGVVPIAGGYFAEHIEADEYHADALFGSVVSKAKLKPVLSHPASLADSLMSAMGRSQMSVSGGKRTEQDALRRLERGASAPLREYGYPCRNPNTRTRGF
jgi:hypothetical protein